MDNKDDKVESNEFQTTKRNIVKQIVHKLRNNDAISEQVNKFIYENCKLESQRKATKEIYEMIADIVFEAVQNYSHLTCNIS